MTIVDVVTVSVCVLVGNEGKGPIPRPGTGSTMNQREKRKRNKTVRRKTKVLFIILAFPLCSQTEDRPQGTNSLSLTHLYFSRKCNTEGTVSGCICTIE